MTVYAPSDFTEVTIPAEGGRGCGLTHRRETGPDGRPVHPFGITCAPCEAYLRATDNRWSPTVAGIVETFDEKLSREQWALKGSQDRDATLTAAIARLAGFGPHELPESVRKMIAGVPPHVPVAGQMVCSGCGNGQVPGHRFCGDCGKPMSSPVPAASLLAGAAA